MNRYQPLEFRSAFAAAAIALAMLTMALAVGVPARMATGDSPWLGGTRASAQAIELSPIEIVGSVRCV